MQVPSFPLPAWSSDPFNGNGKVIYCRGDKILWGLFEGEKMIAGCVQRRIDPILDANQEEYNNNAGKRWGDGRVMAKWPLDFYFEQIMPAQKNGDQKYVKKIANDIDYRKFRTFPGTV